ncbi:MAG: DNA-formamidopyrimidine glycosylase [Malacoplasma sp.]
MPEMPEVQSIIDNLIENKILNKKIINIDTFMEKLFKNTSSDNFKNSIINESIVSIERKGKYLIFHLSNEKVFVVHLRMEGKLFYEANDFQLSPKHILVIFYFDNNKKLIYHDTRRFGTFTLYSKENYLLSKELSKVALDPLDINFNWKYLKKNFKKSTRFIKSILLDQTVVSGIGNIYADEILFLSKINPFKKTNTLTDLDIKNIVESSKQVMTKAIENKGTTISSYLYKKDGMGNFQQYLNVHTKKNVPCVFCGTLIEKTKVNGRGTYLCKICQK